MAAGGKIQRVWADGKVVKFEGEDGKERQLCTAVGAERADDIVAAFHKFNVRMAVKTMRAKRRAR